MAVSLDIVHRVNANLDILESPQMRLINAMIKLKVVMFLTKYLNTDIVIILQDYWYFHKSLKQEIYD